MSNHGKRDLKASIRELAVALERDLEDHPAPRELQNFVAGDLSEDERERIESHLAICRDCTRAALELAEPTELELVKRGEILTERELAAQWERFQKAAGISRKSRPDKLWGLAAVLLVAVIGFATWGVRLSQQPSEIRNPSAVDLVPVSRNRGEPNAAEQQKAQVPGWANEITLNLDLGGVETHPEYRLEIETAEGSRVWNLAGARPGSNGAIAVTVPRSSLPAGAYWIRLFSPQKKEVAVYDLLIEP